MFVDLFVFIQINARIIQTTYLEVVSDSMFEYNIDGHIFSFSEYYDSRFPGMEPIFCYQDHGHDHCFLIVNDVIALPVMNPYYLDKCDW